MNLLIISSFYLFEDSRFGGVKRLYYLFKEMSKNHSLKFIFLDGCYEKKETYFKKSDLQDNLELDFKNIPKLFKPTIDVSSSVKEQISQINDFISEDRFDSVICTFFLSLSVFSVIEKNIRFSHDSLIYLEDDLTFEYFKKDIGLKKNIFFKMWKIFRYYQSVIYYRHKLKSYDLFLCISEPERQIINRLFPFVKTYTTQYGINLSDYVYLEPSSKKELSLGFIGNFKHPPNISALEFFLHSVWPLFLSEFPHKKLFVAGQNIPEALKNKYRDSVEFLGGVQTIDMFYSKIDVFVNPIVSGRGLRTKLIESAAFGKPIITSKLGSEGLEILNLEIAESPEDYLSAYCRLRNAEYYRFVSVTNRRLVEEKYSIQKIAGDLCDIVVSIKQKK